ncbi:AAA+-type ATPase (ISS) isoform B [Chlorella sorokiniana]|uniref:AAA+-type ATPase (ISS) isoform B n=1 Tax=Chlorella sorokiniana TaxID=3076 RepID=A0A2P6TEI7_CHLSO|nr:AAA+-type ATPase (ISS) isoform B [Chlorella sorokiniana]|eukprot:PRW21058.1 AAA+-type ATPase (ISS) isoform B [Chlorella sorokiniana]
MQPLASLRPSRGLYRPHKTKQLVPSPGGPGRRPGTAAQAEPGSGAALPPAAPSNTSGATTSTAAATPLAPASDLASRQLRLLPWQTSSSQDAASTAAGGDAQAARRASGAAASTSGRPPSSSSSSSSSQGGRAQQLRVTSRTRPLGSAAFCEVCGGRRFLQTPAGVQPCMACQAWRQSPDCRPGDGPLLSIGELDLAALEGSFDGGGGSMASSSRSSSSSSSSSSEPGRRPRRKTGPMSPERREAISRGLKSKGAKSEEHKRSIARAMREAHARNPQLRHAPAGRQKKCGHCGEQQQPLQRPPETPAVLGGEPSLPYSEVLQTRWLGPGFSLDAEGGWVFQLPQSKEECVSQAAQAVLRAWDDGVRRQALELLLPQGQPTEDGGWPGGIRQQFRVAKPMVESLLLRLKQHSGLEGRITAELLDDSDCVAAWQSERLGAVLFPTADTLPDLRKIDDALSGERLTLMINPQWQPQGQIISDFGFGKARKAAERFVAAFDEVYYLRRVRVFGDDVRILRCYPGGWQVHYVPPPPEPGSGRRAEPPVLLACEDGKPTFERLIGLLKGVQGSRASKSWLDRFLTSSMGSFNEFAAYNSQALEASGIASGGATTSNAAPAGSLQPAAAAAETRPQPLRDIVTGELLPAGNGGEAAAAGGTPSSSTAADTSAAGPQPGPPAPGRRPVGSSASSKLGVQPPRDIRLQPVQQIASWLGSSSPPSGIPPRPQPEQGRGSSGTDSA